MKIQISTRCKLAMLAIIFAAFAPAIVAQAQLLVDLDGVGGPTQGGYLSWNPPHADNTALNESNMFADATLSTDGTVDVTMTTLNNTFERNYSAITGGPVIGQSDLLRDAIFFNNRQSGNNFYQVQFDDLKAGNYEFKAYHVLTNNVSGDATVDVHLNGTDTGINVTLLNNNPWDQPVEARASIIPFNVASDNDQVTIRYANPTQNHFGLNAFELASAAPLPDTGLKIDINGNGDVTALGWTGWDPSNPNNSALDTGVGTFAVPFATDGDVDVRITTDGNTFERNYGVQNVTGTFSTATPAGLWEDQYFHNNTAGAPMTITLDDLEAGEYQLTLYNYYDNLNTAGHAGGGTAIADVFIDGVDSGIDAIAYGGNDTTYDASFLEAMATVIDFSVVANDDTVTLEFRNPSASHFGLNGFQLIQTAAVPEPASIAIWSLIGMALAGFGFYRARRGR